MDETEMRGSEEEVFYDDGLEYEMDSMWLACAIDSEGAIGLHKARNRRRDFFPEIAVYNTNYEFIERVSIMFNANVESRLKDTSRKMQYFTRTHAIKKLYGVLNRVSQYFIIKRRHAELLMEFCEGRLKWKEEGVRPSFEREFEIFEELKELNRRGR